MSRLHLPFLNSNLLLHSDIFGRRGILYVLDSSTTSDQVHVRKRFSGSTVYTYRNSQTSEDFCRLFLLVYHVLNIVVANIIGHTLLVRSQLGLALGVQPFILHGKSYKPVAVAEQVWLSTSDLLVSFYEIAYGLKACWL